MDSKKRIRESEPNEPTLLISKRARTITDAALHQVNARPLSFREDAPKDLLDTLISDEEPTRLRTVENNEISQNVGISASKVPLNSLARGKQTLHAPVNITHSATSSLFQSASVIEREYSFPSPHSLPTGEAQISESIINTSLHKLPNSASSSLFASASSLKPVQLSSSLFEPLSSHPIASAAESTSSVDLALNKVEEELQAFQAQLPDDDEFEAILVAAKSRQTQQPTRQLHQPTKLRPMEAHVAPTSTKANATSSLFQSARTLSPAVPHAPPSLPENSLFKPSSALSAENTRSSGGSSLFQSARSLDVSEPASPSNPIESSLLAPLSREYQRPASTNGSSSLFQSARSLDDPMPSHHSKALPNSSTSLFAKASALQGSTIGENSLGAPSSSSLFSTAKSLPMEDEPPMIRAIEAKSAQDSTTSPIDEEDELEAMLSSIRAKRQNQPSASKPLFVSPASRVSLGRSTPSAPQQSSSLFQSAKTIPFSSHEGQTSIDNEATSLASESIGLVDEEDEFESFMKNLSAQRKAPPSNLSHAKTSTKPSPSAAKSTSRVIATPKAPNGVRPFKAPAVVTPASHKKNTTQREGEDEVEDALLSLLDDEEDEISTPKPVLLPTSKVTPKHYKATPKFQSSTGIPSIEAEGEIETPSHTRSLHNEYAELLDGIDSDESVFMTQTTPKSSGHNKRFYTSNSSQSPSSPSTSRKPSMGLSNRGSTRSSPYSITASQAMPIVTSTPTKIMEVTSPVRLSRAAAPTPSPLNQNKRVRQAFTTPPQIAADGESNESLKKKRKNILYGRTASHTSESNTKTSRPQPKALFNLAPSEELKSARQPLISLGRAPHATTRAQLLAYKMRPEVIDMTSDTAKLYSFEQLDEDGNMQRLNSSDFYKVLIAEGASPKYLTQAWVDNHYRWIVWKLASMERSFPHEFANKYLTAERVLAQLKYRYEREINNAQRPPLRKILEHDAAASLHLVLMVAAIRHNGTPPRVSGDDVYMNGQVNGAHATGGNEEFEDERATVPKGASAVLEVSDGWYSVNAILDPYLTRLVLDKKIFVGQKLHIFGASIVGNDQPTPPLEVTATTMLRLNSNGTRRAKWFSKLGFQRVPLPAVRLASLKIGGGIAPKLDALVLRVYPLTFTEEVTITPSEDAPTKNGEEPASFLRVTRGAHGEDLALDRYMKRKEDWFDRKTRELTLEILRETALARSRPSPSMRSAHLAPTDVQQEEENRYANAALDGGLTPAQQAKLEERLREAAETEPWLERQVSAAIKVLICDYPGAEDSVAATVVQHLASHGAEGLLTLTAAQKKALHSLGKAILTIYTVNEELLGRLKEGTRIHTSFIAYKGEPLVTTVQNVSNFSSADDPLALQSDSDIAIAPLARLTTTTYSGFEFPPGIREDQTAQTLIQLFARVSTHFDCLDSRIRLRDVPLPQTAFDIDAILDYERRRLIDRFTISNEFDGVGVVMSVLPKVLTRRCMLAEEPELNALKDEWQLDLFLADPSGNLLSLRIEGILDNLPSGFGVGSILCFKNALYDGYDEHLGLYTAIANESTEFLTKAPTMGHLKQRRDEILQWMESMEFSDTMELLSSKIVDISTGLITKSKPGSETTTAIYDVLSTVQAQSTVIEVEIPKTKTPSQKILSKPM